MNEFNNAFWREFQYKIVNVVIKFANEYPIVSWIILYIVGLFFLFLNIKLIKYSLIAYKKTNQVKIIKLVFAACFQVVIFFYFLIKFSIYKSYGLLIYPCIFTWLSTFYLIYISYKEYKKIIEKTTHTNKNDIFFKKPKKQQKTNKQKDVQKSNFKKYKLINKNRVKDKNNNEDKK